MSATFKTSNGKTTIKLEFTATTAKVQSIVGDASHYLHREIKDSNGVVTNPFEDLTNQEKLDIVSDHIKTVIVNAANTYKSIKAQNDARALEEENKHSL